MRRLFWLLSTSAVAVTLLSAWSTTGPDVPRVLSQSERHSVTGSALHYCAVPYPHGNGCDNCVMSIFHDWVWVYGQYQYVQCYQNCTPTPDSWCWQSAYSTQPNPTCNLTSTACAGNITLYIDSGCTIKDPYDPVQACSLFSSLYPNYNAVASGTATGVDCSSVTTRTYSD